MVWFTQVLEIADAEGRPTGRFRLTATSDEDGGGPWGDTECSHSTRDEAEACERCDEYVAKVTGFPSEKARKKYMNEERMLKWFEFSHLPEHLREVSAPFSGLAKKVAEMCEPGPERTVALRKLLEAKDAAVRARLNPGG